jgi:hypothetical protein
VVAPTHLDPLQRGAAPLASGPAAGRRADLDFMRSLVVVGLILVHSAMPFATSSDWFVTNQSTNVGFLAFILWSALWGMPLLFLVSGMGVRYALRKRSAGQFVRERLARLLVPFLFGLVVLVPPMFYLDFLREPRFHDSYGTFWLKFLDLRPALGSLPALYDWRSHGHVLDPAHLWFLYYLLIYSLLLLPVFLFLQREASAPLLDRIGRFLERRGALLFLALPVVLLEAGLGTDENTGGWNRSVYAFLLLYGFLLAGDHRFEASFRHHRRVALWLGVASYVALMLWGAILHDAAVDPLSGGGAAVGWRALKGFSGWMWVVAILGFAGTFTHRRCVRSNRSEPVRVDGGRPGAQRLAHAARYANEAVLPFYVLHEPVIVAIAFWLVRWDVGIVPKYLALVVASFAGTLALYEFGVRRTRLTQFLFGMKPPRDGEGLTDLGDHRARDAPRGTSGE